MKVKLIDEKCYPSKGFINDAGWDLSARIETEVKPLETVLVPAGICVEIPHGYSGDVRGRSGLSSKGIHVSYGTVDFGYTGELKVAVTNISDKPYKINKYERIAQLVINKIDVDNTIEVVEELEGTSRGERGFGSTGR